MHGGDQAPNGATSALRRAPERPRRGGHLCAGPARRPSRLHILEAAFLAAIDVATGQMPLELPGAISVTPGIRLLPAEDYPPAPPIQAPRPP